MCVSPWLSCGVVAADSRVLAHQQEQRPSPQCLVSVAGVISDGGLEHRRVWLKGLGQSEWEWEAQWGQCGWRSSGELAVDQNCGAAGPEGWGGEGLILHGAGFLMTSEVSTGQTQCPCTEGR